MLFELGRCVITATAQEIMRPTDVSECLNRHSRGDWGNLDLADHKRNNEAVIQGDRILSSYFVPSSRNDLDVINVWVITEADRSATTVLLPSDY